MPIGENDYHMYVDFIGNISFVVFWTVEFYEVLGFILSFKTDDRCFSCSLISLVYFACFFITLASIIM